MGATLADGGVNPLTKMRVVDQSVRHYVLAVMTTAGLYETSGDWLYHVGLPGKSGIGGGIVTVSPAKVGWEPLRRPWTPRATASRASWSQNFSRNDWVWTCSCQSRRNELPKQREVFSLGDVVSRWRRALVSVSIETGEHCRLEPIDRWTVPVNRKVHPAQILSAIAMTG